MHLHHASYYSHLSISIAASFPKFCPIRYVVMVVIVPLTLFFFAHSLIIYEYKNVEDYFLGLFSWKEGTSTVRREGFALDLLYDYATYGY